MGRSLVNLKNKKKATPPEERERGRAWEAAGGNRVIWGVAKNLEPHCPRGHHLATHFRKSAILVGTGGVLDRN